MQCPIIGSQATSNSTQVNQPKKLNNAQDTVIIIEKPDSSTGLPITNFQPPALQSTIDQFINLSTIVAKAIDENTIKAQQEEAGSARYQEADKNIGTLLEISEIIGRKVGQLLYQTKKPNETLPSLSWVEAQMSISSLLKNLSYNLNCLVNEALEENMLTAIQAKDEKTKGTLEENMLTAIQEKTEKTISALAKISELLLKTIRQQSLLLKTIGQPSAQASGKEPGQDPESSTQLIAIFSLMKDELYLNLTINNLLQTPQNSNRLEAALAASEETANKLLQLLNSDAVNSPNPGQKTNSLLSSPEQQLLDSTSQDQPPQLRELLQHENRLNLYIEKIKTKMQASLKIEDAIQLGMMLERAVTTRKENLNEIMNSQLSPRQQQTLASAPQNKRPQLRELLQNDRRLNLTIKNIQTDMLTALDVKKTQELDLKLAKALDSSKEISNKIAKLLE